MSTSVLMLHRGARAVTFEELRDVKPPMPEGRWYPLSHGHVLHNVRHTLRDAGFTVAKECLGLSPDNHRFFGTLDLTNPIAEGVSLSVGVRNSTDKTFPLGFCAGTRVFCCDNLAFKSDLLVKKKHTLNGEINFAKAISEAVVTLGTFKEMEAARVARFLATILTDDQADSIILRSIESGVLGIRDLGRVLRHWRNPEHEAFKPRTAWSLLNAFTSALKSRCEKHPAEYAAQTMRINSLIEQGAKHSLFMLSA